MIGQGPEPNTWFAERSRFERCAMAGETLPQCPDGHASLNGMRGTVTAPKTKVAHYTQFQPSALARVPRLKVASLVKTIPASGRYCERTCATRPNTSTGLA